MKHMVTIQDVSREWIDDLFHKIDQPESTKEIGNKILCSLFYEPSTRIRLSFESAALRLGMKLLTVENATANSSATKGESLADTIKIIKNYADIIIIRHPENGLIESLAFQSKIPIINAGSGNQEHPTQALIDAYTIWKKLGRLDNIRVGFVGDIQNSRTVKSLQKLLKKYNNVEIHDFSPPITNIPSALHDLDVVYLTRLQKERGSRDGSYFVFDNAMADLLPKHAIILHALPRNQELPEEVDANPRAAYFDQATNAVKVRMAIIQTLLK